jgi:Predicted dehydrogenases and related proteins
MAADTIKKYKVGIIGAGKIVENSHLPVLKNLENVIVEWIYDVNPNRSKLLSAMYGIRPLFKNWEQEIKSIDVCAITIPYGVRIPYLKAASVINRSVYVEKPFALSVKEHTDTASLFNPYQIAIGFQRRCYKIVNELKQIISSGIFGSLQSIDFRQGYFSLKGGQGYLSDVKLAGGGVIIESAIHSFDQILNFTDAIDVHVEKMKFLQKNNIDYDSTIESFIITSSGKIPVVSEVSTLKNLSNGLTLTFDTAIIKCKLTPDATINFYSRQGSKQAFRIDKIPGEKHSFATNVNTSFLMFWSNFLQALDEERENFTSASSSLLTTKWMEKIYAGINQ